jgi:hypothetical protein
LYIETNSLQNVVNARRYAPMHSLPFSVHRINSLATSR